MNRRSFLQRGAKAATSQGLPANYAGSTQSTVDGLSSLGATMQSVSANAGTLNPYVPSPDKPWNEQRAGHLLRRTGFGVTWEQLDAAVKSSPGALVDAMLQSQPATTTPGSWTSQQPFPTLDNTAINQYYSWLRDLQEWWVGLMLKPELMLREKMTLFWHNHFTSEFLSVYVTQYMYMQNKLYRDNAFGDFKQLTKKVTIDPAMLLYLNGNTSRAGNPNENYARELLELFTLGVGAYANGAPHYTEFDIVDLARALTGWTTSGLASQFNSSRFDNNIKTIFGSSENYGIDGKTPHDVIDLIFEQEDIDLQRKRAAVFLCSKLYQFFVFQIPDPEIVAGMAQTLVDNNWQVGPVLSQLLKSEHFFDDNVIGARIKSPAEFVVGAIGEFKLAAPMNRANTNATVPQTHDPVMAMYQLGQWLFYPPNVKGWPGGRVWLSSSTVPLRIKYSKLWVEPISGSLPFNFDPVGFVKALPNNTDVDEALNALMSLMLPLKVSDATRALLLDELLAGGPAYEWNPDNPNAASRIRACLIRLTNLGEYQLT